MAQTAGNTSGIRRYSGSIASVLPFTNRKISRSDAQPVMSQFTDSVGEPQVSSGRILGASKNLQNEGGKTVKLREEQHYHWANCMGDR